MNTIAHAPQRVVLRLLRTQVCRIQGVHRSVNAARLGACATRVVIGILLAGGLWAQEARPEVEPQDPWLVWKWVNFLILAGGLGYLIRKHAPVFFRQRSQEIQQGILEAAKEKNEAAQRVAAVEQRLASLESEIKSLRATSRAEMAAEGERIGRETEQRLQRIQAQSAQEIALISRNARAELRKYSAQLALDLAQQRIGSRMNTDIQKSLVDGFLQDLRRQVTQDARN